MGNCCWLKGRLLGRNVNERQDRPESMQGSCCTEEAEEAPSEGEVLLNQWAGGEKTALQLGKITEII